MTRSALLLLVLAAGLATEAWARQRVVVLDRGKAAKEKRGVFDRVARALLEDDEDAALVMSGTREDGRPRVGTIRTDHDAAIASDRHQAGWGFEGGSDPRKVLEYVVRRIAKDDPVDVYLVGPFERDDDEDDDDGWGDVWRKAWKDKAPEGSRFHAIGLSDERLALLDDLPGRVDDGVIVLAIGEVESGVRPWSALNAKDPSIHVRIDVTLETLAIGSGGDLGPLRVETNGVRDEISVEARDAGIRADVTLPQAREDVTLRLLPADGALWLAEDVEPVSVRLRTGLEAASKLLPPPGAPSFPFVAIEVMADRPVSWVYRLMRTDTGARGALAVHGVLPEGLTIELGETADHEAFLLQNDVRITFQPRPGHPVDEEGELRIGEEGFEERLPIPYRVAAPRGKVRVTLEAPEEAQPLPWGDDAPWRVRIERLDANAPERVGLMLVTDPAGLASRLAAKLESEGSFALRVRALETAPALDTTTLTLAPENDVLADVEVVGVGRLRRRRPRLALEDTPEGTLLLVADTDGGDEAWRTRVLAERPTVASPGHPFRWEVREQAAGRWEIALAGVDARFEREIFKDRTTMVPLQIQWPPGEAPRGIEFPYVVDARWGGQGWIFVVLASLAGLLGVGIIWSMRPPPVQGTLLYAISGVEGAVGRLDLGPVGRGRAQLHTGEKGILKLGGAGELVGTVSATRVGGYLELRDGSRHLLVDGLTVESDRHRLRYVSGLAADEAPPPLDPVPDLLGPEYDLESGRIGGGQSNGGPARS